MARQHEYSQHFLASPRLVAELIGHSNIRKNDTVLDLGAGSGIIASVLANRCKQVIAIESEPETFKKLSQNLGGVPNVTLQKGDILSFNPPSNPYKIFANIPFSISADVVRKFTETSQPPKSIYLITQKQFAQKLVESRMHFNSQLFAAISPWFVARIRKPLRRTDFTPPPNVDTVLLEIKPRDTALLSPDVANDYRAFVERAFSRQNFFARLNKAAAKVSPERKPSELSANDWVALYRANNERHPL